MAGDIHVYVFALLEHTTYLLSHGIRLQWSIIKLLQIFSNESHLSREGKIDIDFWPDCKAIPA